MTLPVPMLVLLSRRESISPADFRAYWQDVHGPLAARLRGLHHYRQLHLRFARGWWPELPGVDLEPLAADRVDGIADMAFASPEGQRAYAEVAHLTRGDEPHLFRRSVRYLTDEATQAEAPARLAAATPAETGFGLCALLRRRAGDDAPAFAERVRSLLRPLLAAGRARVWTLAPRDNTQNHLLAPHVDHDAPEARQYQAVAELWFDDAAAAHRMLADPAFAEGQQALLGAAHVYSIEQVAPMLLRGAMTASGRRGHTVAQLIARVGASNQLEDDVATRFGEREAPR